MRLRGFITRSDFLAIKDRVESQQSRNYTARLYYRDREGMVPVDFDVRFISVMFSDEDGADLEVDVGVLWD